MKLPGNIARKSRLATYATIGGEVFGGIAAVRALRQARQDGDRLRKINAILGLAAALTAVALVIRELRKGEEE